jgi:hypothetical protein
MMIPIFCLMRLQLPSGLEIPELIPEFGLSRVMVDAKATRAWLQPHL